MSANLTPEYLDSEKKYKQARTPQEKLAALKEMLRTVPKHKGTEKLQSDLKKRIKSATVEAQTKKKGSRKSDVPRVDPEGAGQICLVGAPNGGKSALVAQVSGAKIQVADYPYTTRLPQPGMLRYEDIQFQLVDLPPISEEYIESWLPSIVRYSHGVLLIADLSDHDLLSGLETTEIQLKKGKIRLKRPGFRPNHHFEEVDQPTILVGTKLDRPDARDNLEILEEFYGDRFPILTVSTETEEGFERLAKEIFELRDIVRVYTKQPGKPPDLDQPYVLDRGSTVLDLAEKVHKDLAERFTYARIWAVGKYDGQRVPRDHVINDKDILEIHD